MPGDLSRVAGQSNDEDEDIRATNDTDLTIYSNATSPLIIDVLANDQGADPVIVNIPPNDSEAELLGISGVGQKKLDRYGDGFLSILREETRVEPRFSAG